MAKKFRWVYKCDSCGIEALPRTDYRYCKVVETTPYGWHVVLNPLNNETVDLCKTCFANYEALKAIKVKGEEL